MGTVKEFITHRLDLILNHLDRLYKDLRSKNSVAFLRWNNVYVYSATTGQFFDIPFS